MKIKTYIVDAFTNEPFKGNPAGVCLLDSEIDSATMQAIASELNLSETAFLRQNSANEFSIRYFTPTVEIPFCGHATLASAKVLLNQTEISNVKFTTHFDLKLSAETYDKLILMKFPLYDTTDFKATSDLFEAFGINKPIATRFCKELEMLVVEVKDKDTLLAIEPDFVKAIKTGDEIKELVITAKSDDDEYDFYSRCFCPWIGIDEDPVTGASHSVLAKFWGDKLDKTEMSAYQVSKRGGFMFLKILSDSELEVRSNAKIIFDGMLEI
jgi:PhzF family phenazine biosynthesis protein